MWLTKLSVGGTINVVCAYASQKGCTQDMKDAFESDIAFNLIMKS